VTLKRTPLERGTSGLTRSTFSRADNGLARSKPLAAKSAARAAEDGPDGEWTALKALVDERDHGRCRIAPIWGGMCLGRITHHHVEPTGQGYPRICDPDLLLTTCWAHHTGPNGLHADSARARRLGILR
jgi:hypothetical protein